MPAGDGGTDRRPGAPRMVGRDHGMYMIAVVVLGIALMGLVAAIGWISAWDDRNREHHQGQP